MRPILLFILPLLVACTTYLPAQIIGKNTSLSLSLYNNTTQLPGAGKLGIWGQPVHPGLALSYNWLWPGEARHPWGQSVRLAYHYHRYVQHGISLQFVTEKHFLIADKWQLGLEAGAGYLHAFRATPAFELNETSRTYEQLSNPGRAQWMVTTGFTPHYRVRENWSVFLRYQFYLQGTFVNEYVPLLPNTALHVGMQYYLTHLK